MRTSLNMALTTAVCIDAFIWLVSVIPTLYYAFTHRALPRVAGIRLMGGPFEALGLEGPIVAGVTYVVVSALNILTAYWLWESRRDGGPRADLARP